MENLHKGNLEESQRSQRIKLSFYLVITAFNGFVNLNITLLSSEISSAILVS
jgi:hypothetical protein